MTGVLGENRLGTTCAEDILYVDGISVVGDLISEQKQKKNISKYNISLQQHSLETTSRNTVYLLQNINCGGLTLFYTKKTSDRRS